MLERLHVLEPRSKRKEHNAFFEFIQSGRCSRFEYTGYSGSRPPGPAQQFASSRTAVSSDERRAPFPQLELAHSRRVPTQASERPDTPTTTSSYTRPRQDIVRRITTRTGELKATGVIELRLRAVEVQALPSPEDERRGSSIFDVDTDGVGLDRRGLHAPAPRLPGNNSNISTRHRSTDNFDLSRRSGFTRLIETWTDHCSSCTGC